MKNTGFDRVIPEYGNKNDPNIRAKYGYLEATISIIGNTILCLLKIFLGLFINSIALIADGIHSLSDVSTSGVVILGFRIAKKQPDEDHPYGHGRAEYIATLVIAILLILVGLGFIQQSVERIINNESIQHQEYAIIISIVVLLSAAIKEIMARYSNAIAKKIKSDVLKADAWHHRSDAISSIGVAFGILGARYGFPILDPLFAMAVSFIIMYVGYSLLKTSANFLLGTAPDKTLIQEITILAEKTEGIIGVHKINIHDYGTKKIVTLHAEVESDLSIEQGHALADLLEKNIRKQTYCSPIIHLEPSSLYYDNIGKKLQIANILKKYNKIISFHKVQVIHVCGTDNVKMHLRVDKHMSVEESHRLSDKIEGDVKKECGPCLVDIHFDPD